LEKATESGGRRGFHWRTAIFHLNDGSATAADIRRPDRALPPRLFASVLGVELREENRLPREFESTLC